MRSAKQTNLLYLRLGVGVEDEAFVVLLGFGACVLKARFALPHTLPDPGRVSCLVKNKMIFQLTPGVRKRTNECVSTSNGGIGFSV